MNTTPAVPGPAPAKSRALTVLAWTMIGFGGVLLPISALSQLMILAGSYGTSTSDPGGWFTVVVAPVAGFVCGIGLLRRRLWALVAARMLFPLVCLVGTISLLRAPAEPYVYYSPGGVKNTVTTSPQDRGLPLAAVLVSAAAAAGLWSRRIRQEFAAPRMPFPYPHAPVSAAPPVPLPAPPANDWRTGHLGRDSMFYEEWHGGAWHRLSIEGEMLMGPAHHVIYFASPERWATYPEWARHRRTEIVSRIKQAFPAPDYEHDDPADPAPRPIAMAGAVPPPLPTPSVALEEPAPARRAALYFCISIFAVMAAVPGWLCCEGLRTGATWLPSWTGLPLQSLHQSADPAWFRFVLSIYGVLSAGSLAFVIWLASAGIGHRGRADLLSAEYLHLR